MRPKDPIQKLVEVQDTDHTRFYGAGRYGQEAQRPKAPPPASIFLVGLRGSGKSTLGRALAKLLGKTFVDLDERLTAKAGRSIAQLVADQGWDAFRDLEAQVLADVCANPAPGGQIVATGGGVVLRPDNRELLRQSGKTFYLLASIPQLLKRLEADPGAAQRPPLPGAATLADELRDSLRQRDHLYLEVADIILGADKPMEELVEDAAEKARLFG